MTTPSQSHSVRQKIEIPFSYAAGTAVTRFLTGLRDRVIVASVCGKCGRRSVPPLSFCGRCWLPITQFTDLAGEGTLVSWSRDKGGNLVGLIRCDGADSSLAHRLSVQKGTPRISARVAPVWREERTASILDIEHFSVLE